MQSVATFSHTLLTCVSRLLSLQLLLDLQLLLPEEQQLLLREAVGDPGRGARGVGPPTDIDVHRRLGAPVAAGSGERKAHGHAHRVL